MNRIREFAEGFARGFGEVARSEILEKVLVLGALILVAIAVRMLLK